MQVHLQVLKPALSPKEKGRGQAMVLSALSMFLLALMMIMSFNVSHALHSKIQLQQHADAQAYSTAVVQARTLNYFAVGNRAIAAALVSANNMHGYVSWVSLYPQYMKAGKTNMLFIAFQEFAQCGCWTCIKHCFHGIEALKKRQKFGKAARDWGNRVSKLDTKMRSAMTTLQLMMNAIHGQQTYVMGQTAQTMLNGKSFALDKIKATNAPKASDVPQVIGAMNANGFSCAIDGQPLCVGGPAKRSAATLSKELTSVANATRNKWAGRHEGRSILMWGFLSSPKFMQELMQKIQGNGFSFPLPGNKGVSATVSGGGKGNLHNPQGNQGLKSSADDHGTWLLTQWRDGFWATKAGDAYVYSEGTSGGHSPSVAHSGNHKFDGANGKDFPCVTGNCFMSFRANPDPKKDYGQPSVYAYVTMPMRLGTVEEAPWQLDNSATLKSELGGAATLRLAATDGAALSKAKVYFHRLDNWQAPPNMFDPYWRAKLHPLSKSEAILVLGAAGNTDAAAVAAGTPQLPY